ncbi:MAG: PAS domain-containing protein, partial [Alphaproteobacteria bacterium]|nr:PAS domain-containing protein [Alphaproteobacteria bacterium]
MDPSSLHHSARTLFTYWQSIHSPEGLPGRQHFDPRCVVPLLPNLVLVDVHRAPFRFRYRLLGTRVDAAHGKPLTGKWLD